MKIVVSNKFKRSFRKFTRRNTKLQRKIEEVISRLSENVFDSSLGTHKLEGKLTNLLACSCGYDCRVVFVIETDKKTNEKVIVLLDVGTHFSIHKIRRSHLLSKVS